MRQPRKLSALFTATAAAALLLSTTSVFAQSRPESQSDPRGGQYDRDRDRGIHNNDNRITTRGKIRSFNRERDGYRIYLDRGNYSYWVPASQLGRHQLRIGLDVRLGGIFRGGYVWVDALGWPGDPYYNEPDGNYDRHDYGRDAVTGRVERVELRRGRMVIREDRTGRSLEVDASALDPYRRRLDLTDVRRGDRITLRGTWGHGLFRALRIESIQAR